MGNNIKHIGRQIKSGLSSNLGLISIMLITHFLLTLFMMPAINYGYYPALDNFDYIITLQAKSLEIITVISTLISCSVFFLIFMVRNDLKRQLQFGVTARNNTVTNIAIGIIAIILFAIVGMAADLLARYIMFSNADFVIKDAFMSSLRFVAGGMYMSAAISMMIFAIMGIVISLFSRKKYIVTLIAVGCIVGVVFGLFFFMDWILNVSYSNFVNSYWFHGLTIFVIAVILTIVYAVANTKAEVKR